MVAAVVLIAGGRLRDRLVEDKRDELARVGRVIGAEWQPGVDPDTLAQRAGNALGYRVTLIDSAGVVVGDAGSTGGAAPAENHYTGRSRRARSGPACRSATASAGDDEPLRRAGILWAACACRSPRRLEEIVLAHNVRGGPRPARRSALRVSSRSICNRRRAKRTSRCDRRRNSRRPALSAPGEVGDLATAAPHGEQLATRLGASRPTTSWATAARVAGAALCRGRGW